MYFREGVYFDGALPASKRQTRIDRLDKLLENLKKFMRDYDNNYGLQKWKLRCRYGPKAFTCNGRVPEGVEKPLRDLLSDIKGSLAPAPPFLVTSVVEALAATKYADRTWIVDGEADGFCAAAAYEVRKHCDPSTETYIFTNDSDLVVWDSGIGTHVVTLDELMYFKENNGYVLKALSFTPSDMKDRLRPGHVTDMVIPAYLMQDPRVQLPQALTTSSQIDQTTKGFLVFSGTFMADVPRDKLKKQKEACRNVQRVPIMDIRTAELISHAISLKTGATIKLLHPSSGAQKRGASIEIEVEVGSYAKVQGQHTLTLVSQHCRL